MDNNQKMVRQFHRHFGFHIGDEPFFPKADIYLARNRLMREEFDEMIYAINQGDLPGAVKEMCDLIYAVYGTALAFGVDLEPAFEAVHLENMRKEGVRDGKAVKLPDHRPANIKGILDFQKK